MLVAVALKCPETNQKWTDTIRMFNYGYTRAVFRDYTDSLKVKVGGQPVQVDGQTIMVRQTTETQFVDYTDKYVPYVPQHTFGAMADYRLDFPNSFLRAFTLGVNAHAQGKTYWEPDNLLAQNFYALLGAHVALDLGCATLDVWGRNLTDTHYHTFLVSGSFNAASITQRFAQLGNPLQVGLDVRFHF